MSWDVLLAKREADPGSAGSLGTSTEIRAKISQCFPDVDWRRPDSGVFRSGDLSIEFAVGSEEVVDTVMLHVRGEGDPFPMIVELCRSFSWSALDTSSGEWLDLDNPSPDGWDSFRQFRDEVTSAPGFSEPGALPKSDLRILGQAVIYRDGKPGERTHDLSAVDNLEIRTATSWGAVIFAAVAAGLGILLWSVVSTPWIRWPIVALGVVTGCLFLLGARSQKLFLATGETVHAYWLFGRDEEIRAFSAAARDAFAEAKREGKTFR